MYYASGRRYFQYEEDRPGFVLPPRYDPARRASWVEPESDANTLGEKKSGSEQNAKAGASSGKGEKGNVTVTQTAEPEGTEAETPSAEDAPTRASESSTERGLAIDEKADPNIVDWYGPDDPECPFNVSSRSFYQSASISNFCVL